MGGDPPFLGGAHCESLNCGYFLTPHGMKGLIEPIYLGGMPPPCAARRGPRGCEWWGGVGVCDVHGWFTTAPV